MNLWEQFYRHAIKLLGNPPGSPSETSPANNIELRRAVSAAYYGLFHRLSHAFTEWMAPQLGQAVADKTYRWLEHGDVKKVCQEFARKAPTPLVLELFGEVPDDVRILAENFVGLQKRRHSADYDAIVQPDWQSARLAVELSVKASAAWGRLDGTKEGNIFLLSLLLWKKHERGRD